MDPVANLKRQREIAKAIMADEYELTDAGHAADELAELVLVLDEWRLRGGYDPYNPSYRETP